jgi:hypothetical protein
MPTVHTRYVTYNRMGGRRLHAGTATDDIVAPLATVTPDGGTYQAWASPSISWTDSHGMHSANFAFWWVVGALGGASVTTSQSLSCTVDGSDVQAVAWYLPAGGSGGNGPPAVYIDAFDVDQGRFFDEDFVTVTPDAALSANANETGVVPTTSAEDILAVTSIESVPFLDWTEFVQPTPRVINNEDLHADASSSAVAFAFYLTPVTSFGRPPRYEVGTWVSYGVTVDAGGVTGHGPVPPWNPFLRQLAAGLALADAASLVAAELQGALRKLAADQVALASRQIANLIVGGERLEE